MAVKPDPVSVAHDAAQRIAAALEAVRVDIIRAKDERDGIALAPVSLDIAQDRLFAFCDRMEQDASGRFDASRFMAPGYRMPSGADFQSMTATVMVDLIREGMKTRIADAYRDGPGLTDEDRAEALAAIDARLLRLELSEESMVREAERAGLDILRRGNASPVAVLAPDEALA